MSLSRWLILSWLNSLIRETKRKRCWRSSLKHSWTEIDRMNFPDFKWSGLTAFACHSTRYYVLLNPPMYALTCNWAIYVFTELDKAGPSVPLYAGSCHGQQMSLGNPGWTKAGKDYVQANSSVKQIPSIDIYNKPSKQSWYKGHYQIWWMALSSLGSVYGELKLDFPDAYSHHLKWHLMDA